MAIITEHGEYVVECDVCGEVEKGFSDWSEAKEWMFDNGWRSARGKDGEWESLCVVCADRL